MADYVTCLPSPTDNKQKKPTSFPRLFTVFTLKPLSDVNTEAVMSPTSTLDSQCFSAFKNPFWFDSNTPRTPKALELEARHKLESEKTGLGIVDAIKDHDFDSKLSRPENRKVLFGSQQLRIQIPPLPPSVLSPSPAGSPKSPPEFGIKTRNSQLGPIPSGLSPSQVNKSWFGSGNPGMEHPNSPGAFTGCLAASEMELSEDYTCVICHGPNPRTTHIFEDCVVESCCGVVGLSALKKEDGFGGESESFLSFCFTCKKDLGQGKDIYMYRGEKAFCSHECRYQEMMLEDGTDRIEADDVCGTCS